MGFYSKSFRFEGGGRRIIGLKRTGKSCRLRWVNYLHPGLKRGKMTPHEEKLVLELHSQWGNRWSRIARRLPGRTDNEIKNYWRTHMRKKAQERKRAMSPSSSSSKCSSSSSINEPSDSRATTEITTESSHDTRSMDNLALQGKNKQLEEEEEVYSMDDIWKDITTSEAEPIKPVYRSYNKETPYFSCHPLASPMWEYTPDMLWKMDEGDNKSMYYPGNNPFPPSYDP